MTTISIEIQDEMAERLAKVAQQHNTSVEKMLFEQVEKLISAPDTEFKSLVARIIEEDKDLLMRLA